MTPPGAHHPEWHASPIRLYLHSLRKQFGLSQSAAAKELGYSTSLLNAWERGYTAPSFVQLTEWASIFDLQVLLTPRVANHAQVNAHARAKAVADMRGMENETGERLQKET